MEVVNTTSTTNPVNMYNYLNNYILNPSVFIIIFLIIVAYYVFSSSLFSKSDNLGMNNSESSMNVMSIIIIAILIVLVIINAFEYFFSINIVAYVQGLFTPNTQVDIIVDQSRFQSNNTNNTNNSNNRTPQKEVFNIPGNYYNYENARALCKAYGSELATYDQIEKAYNNGAEWCNYGWSANQLALFPTQSKTYNHLQGIPGHENDCGRTGINGGYIANPRVRFGVNCYGKRPEISEEEQDLMKTSSPFPETIADQVFQKRVDFWKQKIDQILVSPFNYSSWGL
jgi:hypothetical protein